jgi:hypothetical protein
VLQSHTAFQPKHTAPSTGAGHQKQVLTQTMRQLPSPAHTPLSVKIVTHRINQEQDTLPDDGHALSETCWRKMMMVHKF